MAQHVDLRARDRLAVSSAEAAGDGGRLFLIRGLSPAMEATLTTLGPDSQYVTDSLFETDLPYLVGAAPLPRFVL